MITGGRAVITEGSPGAELFDWERASPDEDRRLAHALPHALGGQVLGLVVVPDVPAALRQRGVEDRALVAAVGLCTDEGSLSFVHVFCFCIWIFHINENWRGRMTECPRLSRPGSAR